jgi:hypothetical protein
LSNLFLDMVDRFGINGLDRIRRLHRPPRLDLKQPARAAASLTGGPSESTGCDSGLQGGSGGLPAHPARMTAHRRHPGTRAGFCRDQAPDGDRKPEFGLDYNRQPSGTGSARELAERQDVVAAPIVGPAVELGGVLELLPSAAVDGKEGAGRSGSEVRSPAQSFSNWSDGEDVLLAVAPSPLHVLMVT